MDVRPASLLDPGWGRARRLAGGVAVLFALVGCATAGTRTSPSVFTPPTISPCTLRTPTIDQAGLTAVPGVQDYYYSDSALPSGMAQRMVTETMADSVITSVVVCGVRDSSLNAVGAQVLIRYNAAVTTSMDKTPVASTFDRVAASFGASQGTAVTATNYVLSGIDVRVLQTVHLSEVIALKKGGPFMELLGPVAKDLLDFARVYLAANW